MARFSWGMSWEMWSRYVWMISLFSVNSSCTQTVNTRWTLKHEPDGLYEYCWVFTVLKWCPMMMSTRLLVQPLNCTTDLLLMTPHHTLITYAVRVTLEAAQSTHPLAHGSTLIRTKPSTKLGSFSWKTTAKFSQGGETWRVRSEGWRSTTEKWSTVSLFTHS